MKLIKPQPCLFCSVRSCFSGLQKEIILMCTKMLIPTKYCILCIKRLSPNFASNIKRSCKGINQKLLFPLKIPWFPNNFRKKKSLILILEAKFGDDS